MNADNRLNRRRFLRSSATIAAAATGGFCAPGIVRGDDKVEPWGELVGRVIYEGDAPARAKLTVDKDVDCCGKFDIRDESLMVGKDGGLANVFVYVRTRGVEIHPDLEKEAEETVLLDNRDCIFVPHCMAVWYDKQKLRIVNSDPVAQNVAFSPLGDLPANIVLPPPPHEAAEAEWTFRRKQTKPVAIACNYHPWESGYVLPLDSPYVDISKNDGTFRIPKLPVGEIEFQLWHEKVGYLETPKMPKGRLKKTIKPGENDLGDIEIDPKWLKKK